MSDTEIHPSPDQQAPLPPLKVTNANRVAFHMAEFHALKSEIAELVKQTGTSMTFAITTSAGIAAWLLTHPGVGWWARWLPLTVSLLFGSLAWSYYVRIGNKSAYLRRLEEKLSTEGLGWEREFLSRPKLIGAIHTLCWGALNIFGFAVARYYDQLAIVAKPAS